ncbi:MAG: helix-turn-helix transcriptional regulator [Myxococcota bacterium]
MREVPALLFGFMCRTLDRYGVDTATLLHGSPLERVDVGRLGERVDWDELARFLNRCAEGLCVEEQERVGELYPIENRYLHALVRAGVSPRVLYWIAWKAAKPAYPHMDLDCRYVPGGVRVSMEMPPRYRGCPLFFRATVGECRTLTELLGLGPADVEADVGSHHGHYLVRIPTSSSLKDDLEAAGRRLVQQTGWDLVSLVGWLLAQERPWNADQANGLGPLEARAVLLLGQGASLAEIAAELALSVPETRRRLERARMKLDVPGRKTIERLLREAG